MKKLSMVSFSQFRLLQPVVVGVSFLAGLVFIFLFISHKPEPTDLSIPPELMQLVENENEGHPPTVSDENCFIYNTHSGDWPIALFDRAQEDNFHHPHVNHYFCSNDDVPEYQNVLVHDYEYGDFSYKKLLCMFDVLKEKPGCNIIFLDSDTIVQDFTKTYDYVECYHPPMAISKEDPTDTYFVYAEDIDDGLYCGGGYIFVPNGYIPPMLKHLEKFEHYRADDVAFTAYFQRLGFNITRREDALAWPDQSCTPAGHENEFKLQCRPDSPYRARPAFPLAAFLAFTLLGGLFVLTSTVDFVQPPKLVKAADVMV